MHPHGSWRLYDPGHPRHHSGAAGKDLHLDMFTCGVASLANIGGSASAPILAGAYSGALVPVGVLMALMGYVIGTAGGLITANIMPLLA